MGDIADPTLVTTGHSAQCQAVFRQSESAPADPLSAGRAGCGKDCALRFGAAFSWLSAPETASRRPLLLPSGPDWSLGATVGLIPAKPCGSGQTTKSTTAERHLNLRTPYATAQTRRPPSLSRALRAEQLTAVSISSEIADALRQRCLTRRRESLARAQRPLFRSAAKTYVPPPVPGLPLRLRPERERFPGIQARGSVGAL